MQVSLGTRSIWLFSKKTEAVPPETVPADTPISEPVSASPEVASSAPISHSTSTVEVIPAEAVAPVSQSDALDTLTALTPLQYGDLAALGLAGWSPAGLSSWMLELINVSAGLPWFHTIIAGTVLSRLLLLPFSIKQLRNSAALAPHQPRLIELKEELDKAYKTGDKLAVQRVALKQRKVYEESGVSMLPMLLLPFVQLPVSLGMFFGVKRLCALPLEQLHWSGVSFLPDLTVPDPYYILPIASAVLMNLQLHVCASLPSVLNDPWLTVWFPQIGASDMAATADRTTAAHMINAFRVVSIISIPLMGHFPSVCSLSTPRRLIHCPTFF